MSIVIRKDLPYGEPAPPGARWDRKLDLYLPQDASGRTSAVVVIHGGGWVSQTRKDARERSICTDLASAGIAAASIDYTLVDLDEPVRSPPAWPRMLFDCRDAVVFLRARAAEFGIDSERIGAIGGSAGGHLAAMLAVTAPDVDTGPAPGATVEAAVVLYGVGDLLHWIPRAGQARLAVAAAKIMFGGTPEEAPEAYAAASPLHYASPDSAPMLLIHGEADEIIAASESRWFVRGLERAGAEAELILVPGAPHSFDLHPGSSDLTEAVVGFFRRHLS